MSQKASQVLSMPCSSPDVFVLALKTLVPEDPKPPYEDGRRATTERRFDAWRRYLQWQAVSPLGAGGGHFSAEEESEGKFFEVACTYATTHRRAFVTEKGYV